MPANRWLDRTQPQTLFIAVVLLYINAVFNVLAGFASPRFLLLGVGEVIAGYAIANEKKWGYILGVIMAILPVLALFFWHNGFALGLISLMFQVGLICLLLHPQSREYQRIWFK
jgi:hypothetical protein